MSGERDGPQRAPRGKDSYGGRYRARKPYCLDCGGLPMLSAYIRKGRGGTNWYVVGYWCRHCDQMITATDWLRHHSGEQDSAAAWSFSRRYATQWMPWPEFIEFLQPLREELVARDRHQYEGAQASILELRARLQGDLDGRDRRELEHRVAVLREDAARLIRHAHVLEERIRLDRRNSRGGQ